MSKKKPSYTIRIIPTDGDANKIIDEIISERIKSVLLKHNALNYNDKNESNHTTGVIGNDTETG